LDRRKLGSTFIIVTITAVAGWRKRAMTGVEVGTLQIKKDLLN
jgi:hypothetical protein